MIVYINKQGMLAALIHRVWLRAAHTGLQRDTLEQTLDLYGSCGIRRRMAGQEKSRAKERVVSFRPAGGVWDRRNQRPHFGTSSTSRPTIRDHEVFAIPNWTELDMENIEIPSAVPSCFAERRLMIYRNGTLINIGD